jgi:hypothetical protein
VLGRTVGKIRWLKGRFLACGEALEGRSFLLRSQETVRWPHLPRPRVLLQVAAAVGDEGG